METAQSGKFVHTVFENQKVNNTNRKNNRRRAYTKQMFNIYILLIKLNTFE